MKTIEKEKVLNLPIFKHFDSTSLTETGKNALDKFKKGEWTIFQSLKTLVIVGGYGALGYFSWIYVLPPIFQAIGATLAVAGTIVVSLALVLLAPVIIKALRRLTRKIHQKVIQGSPFEELEDQRNKMVENQEKFRKAKGKIASLQEEMEIAAAESEKNATKIQEKIKKCDSKAKELKAHMESMEKKDGKAAKASEEYVQKNAEFIKVLSEGRRSGDLYEQEKQMVSKYGARAVSMRKFGHRLLMVETAMDIKIQDFDATVQILKKDFEFAQKSRQATESAKDAMMFTKGWELEYALDVVTATIADDIAITTGNLTDINRLTDNINVDSEEEFRNLDKLATEIRVGTNVLPDADKYNDPDYVLTAEDKRNSGGFGKMF